MNYDKLGRTLFLLMLAATAFGVTAGESLQVVRVNPAGLDVPAGRQIVIQFNRAVVPIGRMQRKREEVPISISPAIDCQWRWLDRSSLACQLGEKNALQQSTQYSLVVWPGIRDQQGETIKEPYVHKFVTARPKIHQAWFAGWKAPGHPVMEVAFNQAVSKASVEEHVYFTKMSKKPLQHIAVTAQPRPDDESFQQKNHEEFRRVWLVQPRYELPLNSSIELKVEPGLVSFSGQEKKCH